MEAAGNYSTLEYDVESGSRGSRYDHVNELIEKTHRGRELSGGEQQCCSGAAHTQHNDQGKKRSSYPVVSLWR